MPVVKIFGMPGTLNNIAGQLLSEDGRREALASFSTAIQQCFDSPALELTPDQVAVFMLPDHLESGQGEELIIEVTGLYKTRRRTKKVRRALAENIKMTTVERLAWRIPQCVLIEVFIQPFDPENGFANWDKKKEKAP